MEDSIRIVGSFTYQDGIATYSDRPTERDYKNGKAISFSSNELHHFYPLNTKSEVLVGNILNRQLFKAGMVVSTPVGKRIIIEASEARIIFVEHENDKVAPGFFVQTPGGFHSQWLDLVRQKASSKLASTTVLAEWEVQLLIGMVAGASWKGLSLVIGVDVFEEAISKKKTKSTKSLIRQLQILCKYRNRLKAIAPKLTETLTQGFWIVAFKGQAKHIFPEMAKDPKIAARAAGTISVQLGKQLVDRKLTASATVWTLLSQISMKAAAAIPAAATETLEDFQTKDAKELATRIVQVLNSVGTITSTEDISLITNELTSHPEEISDIFSDMIIELKQPIRD